MMKVKKILLVIAGILFLIIGAIGIVVPVLPTTPLVILSAICFSGSSEKLYQMLLKSKYFGSYIENYRNKTGVPAEVKRRAIFFLWAMLGISMFLSKNPKIIILLAAVGIGVTIHICSLKKKEEKS
ncbi:YbaN family protein [Clostridiales bacterium BAD-6]|uniref:YbaN family protein n=2 Tax=Sinanaerobacter chloroacetimidivorans TaxID=2818044 RepID=A0A8J7VZQ4_9FIRM|nr:YbaN family protein [Sinanaerobacter chloroacetimidivorans]